MTQTDTHMTLFHQSDVTMQSRDNTNRGGVSGVHARPRKE